MHVEAGRIYLGVDISVRQEDGENQRLEVLGDASHPERQPRLFADRNHANHRNCAG